MPRCTFELFGMARYIAGIAEVEVEGGSVREALRALGERCPKLLGRVLSPDGEGLAEGHTLNLDGRAFITDLSTALTDGQHLLLLPSAVGGRPW